MLGLPPKFLTLCQSHQLGRNQSLRSKPVCGAMAKPIAPRSRLHPSCEHQFWSSSDQQALCQPRNDLLIIAVKIDSAVTTWAFHAVHVDLTQANAVNRTPHVSQPGFTIVL